MELLEGDLDLYEFLEVSPSASVDVIRRQYRRIALLYHPDKNPDPLAAQKFQLLSAAYLILSDDKTRHDYDEIRAYKLHQKQRLDALDEHTRNLKEQLLKAERASTFNATDVYNNVSQANVIEKLREDGSKRRRQLQAKGGKNFGYVSYKDIPLETVNIFLSTVVVQWKHRPELEGKFNLDILKDIMSLFGDISLIQETSPLGKYRAAKVEFVKSENAQDAVNYDYKTAKKWDKTQYRKLASLLRDCQWEDSGYIDELLRQYN